ncbi:hypothetical protein COL516b_012574 [Colletotrichum fioriniae]|nr:uncharacterized protein COL516b_012574 [Colletotrichum fioriniae]KAJ0295422.1 hypothetical protein COL516b_012574 [Colletotrichum fioriniae]
MAQAPLPPTVIAQKQSFLATQARLLSQPLQPSHAWLIANEAAESSIPDPVVEHVAARLNTTLLQHSRRAYSHQASRHVAEQIDVLYLSQLSAAQNDSSEGLSLSLDLSERDATTFPMEVKRYVELAGRLKELVEQRQQARARVERLRRMKALLDPFRTEDAGAGVQENLVTRDGEIEKEMEKMRVLLARVGGRVGLLPVSAESVDLLREDNSLIVEPVATGEKRKLDDLLGSF